jgi:beta-galactosidase/beta-glucuronidase
MEQEPEHKVAMQVSQEELEWDFQLQLVVELLVEEPHRWDQWVQPQLEEVHYTLQ